MTIPVLERWLRRRRKSDSPCATARPPFPAGPATQAVSIFALAGASLGLFIATVARLTPRTFGEFLASNAVADPERWRLFLWLVGGGVLGTLTAVAILAFRGRLAVPGLCRAGEILLPLCLIGVLRSLFTARPWHDQPLTFLVGLSLAVVVLERALRRAQRALPESFTSWLGRLALPAGLSRWLPLGLVLAGSVWYSAYFSYYTLLNHQRLQTMAYDLGINVNWAYNALHGHFARNTVVLGPDGGNYFGVHAVFAMLTWLPFFAIRPGAEFFLIFQSVAVGFAATSLYLFATTQIPRWSAVVVAYAFLFFAPLHGPNFYDFHELMPPLFFHFLLYWAIAQRRNWLVFVLVPVIWSYREDLTIGLVALGFFLLVTGVRPRVGAAIAVASAAWFVVMKLVIMPRLWNGWFDTIYQDLQAGQRGYGTILMTITSNPAYFLGTLLKQEKLVYFLHMFAPLAFLPARRWSLLLLVLPGFAFSLLTTRYAPTVSIGFQYTCHAIPYLFCGTVLMLGVLSRSEGGAVLRRAALGAMMLAVASHSFVFGAVLQHETFVGGFHRVEFDITPQEQQRYQTLKRMAALIPQEASVAATEMEVPHVAARLNVFTLKGGQVDVDYLLVNQLRLNVGGTRATLKATLQRNPYGLLMQADNLYLFRRNHSSPDTAAALRELGVQHKPR